MDKKVTIIVAIAVAAIVIGGGVAAVLFMNNSGKGSEVNFDKHYFDLKGAKSLAVIKESNTTGSSVVASVGGDSGGSATIPFGDAAGEKSVLYKKNELGEYVKVKLYESKEKMDSETEDIQNDFSVVSMDVTDNGKYAYMVMGKAVLSHDGSHTYYEDIRPIVVSIETGKIYQLPLIAQISSIPGDKSPYAALYEYNRTLLDPENYSNVYFYMGYSDSYLFFKYHHAGVFHIYSGTELDGEFVLKEIVNPTIIPNSGCYKFYNNGILRVFTNSMDTNSESYLVFPNGELKLFPADSLFVCGDNICTSVTYRDLNNYFPESATIIKGYNTETHSVVTETVNYTVEQSYDMAIKSQFQNEIYKKTESGHTSVFVMNSVNSIKQIQLNDDCTSSDIGTDTLPFKLASMTAVVSSNIFDDSALPGNYSYTVKNGHICQYAKSGSVNGISSFYNPGDVVVSDGCLYKVIGDALKKYNLFTQAYDSIVVPELVRISSLDIDYDRALIEGISDSGAVIKGFLDFSNGTVDLSHTNILREIRIAALN